MAVEMKCSIVGVLLRLCGAELESVGIGFDQDIFKARGPTPRGVVLASFAQRR